MEIVDSPHFYIDTTPGRYSKVKNGVFAYFSVGAARSIRKRNRSSDERTF
jgi:hypothetical protein